MPDFVRKRVAIWFSMMPRGNYVPWRVTLVSHRVGWEVGREWTRQRNSPYKAFRS